MAKALKLEDIALWGAVGLGAYEGGIIVLGIDPLIGPDPIHDFLVGTVLPFFNGLLGSPSPSGELPESCNKTCVAGQHLNDACQCVVNDTTTPPTTTPTPTYNPPPLPAGTCMGDHLNRYPASKQDYFCKTWCTGWKCDRYCFCKECQTGACA